MWFWLCGVLSFVIVVLSVGWLHYRVACALVDLYFARKRRQLRQKAQDAGDGSVEVAPSRAMRSSIDGAGPALRRLRMAKWLAPSVLLSILATVTAADVWIFFHSLPCEPLLGLGLMFVGVTSPVIGWIALCLARRLVQPAVPFVARAIELPHFAQASSIWWFPEQGRGGPDSEVPYGLEHLSRSRFRVVVDLGVRGVDLVLPGEDTSFGRTRYEVGGGISLRVAALSAVSQDAWYLFRLHASPKFRAMLLNLIAEDVRLKDGMLSYEFDASSAAQLVFAAHVVARVFAAWAVFRRTGSRSAEAFLVSHELRTCRRGDIHVLGDAARSAPRDWRAALALAWSSCTDLRWEQGALLPDASASRREELAKRVLADSRHPEARADALLVLMACSDRVGKWAWHRALQDDDVAVLDAMAVQASRRRRRGSKWATLMIETAIPAQACLAVARMLASTGIPAAIERSVELLDGRVTYAGRAAEHARALSVHPRDEVRRRGKYHASAVAAAMRSGEGRVSVVGCPGGELALDG